MSDAAVSSRITPSSIVSGQLVPRGQRPGADSGDPQIATHVIDTLGSGNVGIWECRPGGWPVVNRTDTEACFIVSGSAIITDDATGAAREIHAGDFVVLPVGWTGRWDVTETIRKVYAIY